MDKPVALVTGASRGIGYTTALALAAKGYHIVAVARTQGGLEELDDAIQAAGGSATLVKLDLTDGEGVDRLGASLYERFGKLDMLVANAAMLGTITPLAHMDVKVFDRVMALNVTAQWRLLRSMDALLRAAPAAQVLFVTSSVAQAPRAYWGAYAASKAAGEVLFQTYAEELKSTNVRVHLFNPGATNTAMRRQALPGEDESSLQTPSAVAVRVLQTLGL